MLSDEIQMNYSGAPGDETFFQKQLNSQAFAWPNIIEPRRLCCEVKFCTGPQTIYFSLHFCPHLHEFNNRQTGNPIWPHICDLAGHCLHNYRNQPSAIGHLHSLVSNTLTDGVVTICGKAIQAFQGTANEYPPTGTSTLSSRHIVCYFLFLIITRFFIFSSFILFCLP